MQLPTGSLDDYEYELDLSDSIPLEESFAYSFGFTMDPPTGYSGDVVDEVITESNFQYFVNRDAYTPTCSSTTGDSPVSAPSPLTEGGNYTPGSGSDSPQPLEEGFSELVLGDADYSLIYNIRSNLEDEIAAMQSVETLLDFAYPFLPLPNTPPPTSPPPSPSPSGSEYSPQFPSSPSSPSKRPSVGPIRRGRRNNSPPNAAKTHFCNFEGCKVACRRPCDLTKHKKRHAKPFKCSEGCKGASFSTVKDRERHEVSKHKKELHLVCTECNHTTARKDNMADHVRRKHPSQVPSLKEKIAVIMMNFELSRRS